MNTLAYVIIDYSVCQENEKSERSEIMKRLISIFLCAAVIFSSVFVLAFATQADDLAFVKGVSESNSLSMSVSDEEAQRFVDEISSSIQLPFKLTLRDVVFYAVDDSIIITAKAMNFLKIKAILTDEASTVYVTTFFMKLDLGALDSLFDGKISETLGMIWDIFDTVYDGMSKGYIVPKESKEVDGLTVDSYGLDIKVLIATYYADQLPAGTNINDMTPGEIDALINSLDPETAAEIRLWQDAEVAFSRTADNTLVDIYVSIPDEESGEPTNISLAGLVSDAVGLKISEIGTNVSSSVARKPFAIFSLNSLIN